MFRIGIIELGITCGLVALAILVPLIVTRGYAAVNRRLKNLEEKFKKEP
ncbi:MAG: hypothetical protein QY332_18685 [Anaerolineales bacterium]|nr:MAG: hypothetical protein QY332_18685 [Anaerolineales bacterium]